MDAVPGAVYNPFKDLWLYIKHRRRHIIDLDDNFTTLSLKHGKLLAMEEQIRGKLKYKSTNKKYDELERQIEDIKRKYVHIESRFKKSSGRERFPTVPTHENVANGGEGSSTSSIQVTHTRQIWTRKFFSNARLDKDVLKLIGEIDHVLKNEDVKLETLVNEDKQVQWKNTLERDGMPLWPYVEKLLEYLENADTKRIGVCGEPQVGKSTVLKMLNDYVLSSSISLKYDVVIWVNFPSKDSGDVKKKMQQEILRSIGEHDEESLVHNATKINKALAKFKYLLILDDVYEGIDLADLGIHDDHELGKIVIGATGEGVLKRMKVDESILIEKLDTDAAEKFFKECLGRDRDDLSMVQPYIKQIIDLLGGHIGALVGIADYMKGLGTNNKDLNVWQAVVHDLQSPNSPENLELGALEKAYKLLYEGLKDKNLRKCLLYVALFPVGFHAHTSYLVECWKAEGFLHGYHTYKEARLRGNLVFCKLTETRLLERSSDHEYLKMPLLVRKVALQIPYPDEEENKLLVRNVSEICSHPSDHDWDIAKRISLMCGKLNKLPESPNCQHTLTLLLQANLELTGIQECFFVNMGNLRVLDLQSTGINGLPESISNLGYLKCLYLNDCSCLQSLPSEMKKLKQLELLDIRRSFMSCLPCEIWFLITLRCLRISIYNLTGDATVDAFSSEFLKLKFLEELTIHVDSQTFDKRLIVDQIKGVLKEAEHHYLKVIWEPKECIALTQSQSNGQDIILTRSSSLITEPTTINNKLKQIQPENIEASTSTTSS